jgi:hypothetical protein
VQWSVSSSGVGVNECSAQLWSLWLVLYQAKYDKFERVYELIHRHACRHPWSFARVSGAIVYALWAWASSGHRVISVHKPTTLQRRSQPARSAGIRLHVWSEYSHSLDRLFGYKLWHLHTVTSVVRSGSATLSTHCHTDSLKQYTSYCFLLYTHSTSAYTVWDRLHLLLYLGSIPQYSG